MSLLSLLTAAGADAGAVPGVAWKHLLTKAVSQMSTPLAARHRMSPPDGYQVASTLDLKEDRQAARTVQAGFGAGIALMVGAAFVLDLPTDSSWSVAVVALVTLVACLAYMVLHELTHGAVLWALTGVRPSYAVRLPYLSTGSPAFLSRRVLVVVALAPLVLWGAVLLALLPVVPQDLFLTVYVVLGLNLAGSAGDVLEAWVVSRLPGAALVRDDGSTTTVYLPTG